MNTITEFLRYKNGIFDDDDYEMLCAFYTPTRLEKVVLTALTFNRGNNHSSISRVTKPMHLSYGDSLSNVLKRLVKEDWVRIEYPYKYIKDIHFHPIVIRKNYYIKPYMVNFLTRYYRGMNKYLDSLIVSITV